MSGQSRSARFFRQQAKAAGRTSGGVVSDVKIALRAAAVNDALELYVAGLRDRGDDVREVYLALAEVFKRRAAEL